MELEPKFLLNGKPFARQNFLVTDYFSPTKRYFRENCKLSVFWPILPYFGPVLPFLLYFSGFLRVLQEIQPRQTRPPSSKYLWGSIMVAFVFMVTHQGQPKRGPTCKNPRFLYLWSRIDNVPPENLTALYLRRFGELEAHQGLIGKPLQRRNFLWTEVFDHRTP